MGRSTEQRNVPNHIPYLTRTAPPLTRSYRDNMAAREVVCMGCQALDKSHASQRGWPALMGDHAQSRVLSIGYWAVESSAPATSQYHRCRTWPNCIRFVPSVCIKDTLRVDMLQRTYSSSDEDLERKIEHVTEDLLVIHSER